MRASDLVVRPGDRVTAAGTFVRRDDGDWLDLAQVHDLMFHPPTWKSHVSVRVVGVDADTIPGEWNSDAVMVMPRRVRVEGVWLDDVITVERQSEVRRATDPRNLSFTIPAPPGGWDSSAESQYVDGLDRLRASGAIVRDQWRRHGSGALLLCVAAGDVDLVEEALSWQLPRRLCVVHSRYTAEQVREVEAAFRDHAREWFFEIWSPNGMDADCQPYAEAHLLRVTDDLAAWVDTLPDGLVTLYPTMKPA